MTEPKDYRSDFGRRMDEAGAMFYRHVVAALMDKGWQPPDGWTNEDTVQLLKDRDYGAYGRAWELIQMVDAGASIEEQRAWIERHARPTQVS